jgi:glucan endo-1,3-alpha-glucosidase
MILSLRATRTDGLLALLLFFLPIAVTGRAVDPHYVFAHYMVCFATYGESLQGYQREITQAQEAGIDGFVLDVGAWDDTQAYYKSRVKLIYDAAEQLGTGFKLSFFVEFPDPAGIINLVTNYARRASTFWYHGQLVLSSWGLNDVPTMGWTGIDWTNGVLNPLRSQGIPVFFIPHFWPPYAHELPSYSDAQFLLTNYSGVVNGLFLFGAAGLPAQLAQCNSNYCAAVHAAGKTFMAGVTPSYWGNLQPSNGRRYFESQGGEGLSQQWTTIITNQPDWVNLVTWNDFHESTYFSPVDNPGLYLSVLQSPVRYCHAGYSQLSSYYIAWYKTGQAPPIAQDSIAYFYRTHSKTAVASDTNDVPVTALYGDVEDLIFTTALLVAPAQLEITSGNTVTTNFLPAGVSHRRTRFDPGAQKFLLRRDGQALFSVQGADVLSQIQRYDYYPASGGASTKVNAPTKLRLTKP